MRSWQTVAFAACVGMLSAFPADAHTLIAPERVQVDRDGHFDFETLLKIEGGGERIAFVEATGLDNIEGLDWVADAECIQLLSEGFEWKQPLVGELLDPRRAGSARISFVTCGVTGSQTLFQAEIEIVPHRSRTLFWTEYADAVRATTVGVGPIVEIVSAEDANAGVSIAVDPIDGRIYWHHLGQFASYVRRAGLFGQEIGDFAGGGKGGLGGIAIKIAARELIHIDPSDCSPCGQVWQHHLDGSAPQALASGLPFPGALAVSEDLEKMCWGDLDLGSEDFNDVGELLTCADLDASNMQSITAGAEVRGMAIDSVLAKVFWTESGDDRIRRANLDGSNRELLDGGGLTEPTGLVVDPLMRKIYWSETVSGRIGRAGLDGSDVEYLLTGLAVPRGIELLYGQSELEVQFSGNQLEWAPIPGASRYDVVHGSLSVLRQTDGSFDVATDECAAALTAGPQLDAGQDPESGEGFWWLVRAVSVAGKGTYDASAVSQADARDQEIVDSGIDCP